MSETVVLRHPTLPEHQEIEVSKDALFHYAGAGWQQVPQEELDERAARAAAAAAEAAEAEQGAASETSSAADQVTEDEPEPEPAEAPTRPARSRAKAPEKKGE